MAWGEPHIHAGDFIFVNEAFNPDCVNPQLLTFVSGTDGKRVDVLPWCIAKEIAAHRQAFFDNAKSPILGTVAGIATPISRLPGEVVTVRTEFGDVLLLDERTAL